VVFAIQASVTGSDKLSTAKTFSSLALISILTSPAESFLQGLPMLGMATGCLDRIQSFLLSESYNNNKIALDNPADHETGAESTFELQHLPRKQGAEYGIIVHGASVRPGSDVPVVIHDVNFQVVTGSLNMVVGVVGSGKSTLLKAIIGELKCETGSISTVSPHMAYCSQTPWLQNTTVRKIVCGYSREIDQDDAWYKSVMHACAFDQDVLALPDQDDTLIGSRGVTLSGGQKQRLVRSFLFHHSGFADNFRPWQELYTHETTYLSLMIS
jgi:ATP-binding cassette subfamily C (CFTR/MRP) protein 1